MGWIALLRSTVQLRAARRASARWASAGLDFTDYLSLLKIDGRWRIVHKLFHLHG